MKFTMKFTRALALLLAAAVLAGAPSVHAQETLLESMQKQCLVTGESALALDEELCSACMAQMEAVAKYQSMWACGEQLCQGEAFGTVAADPSCVDCLVDYDPRICLQCINNVPFEFSAIDSDDASEVAEARTWCQDCASGELHPVPGLKDDGGIAQYYYGCSACANLPSGSDEREWCRACIASTYASAAPSGYLSRAEAAQLDADGMKQLTDFGKCFAAANLTYSVRLGLSQPTGIYSSCVWNESEFVPPPKTANTVANTYWVGECVDCMDAALDYSVQSGNTTKAYACALCRQPDWFDSDAAASDACAACVANPAVYDAWGCTNCYERAFATAGSSEAVNATACTECVVANPYTDSVGTYNWACAECAGIADAAIRALCIACIQTPASDSSAAGTLADDLANASWVGTASEIICSCVDMAKTSTWDGSLADWYTFECPNCTAMEKTCYKKRNITWSGGLDIADPRPAFVAVYASEADLYTPGFDVELPEGYALVDPCDTAKWLQDAAQIPTTLSATQFAQIASALQAVAPAENFATFCVNGPILLEANVAGEGFFGTNLQEYYYNLAFTGLLEKYTAKFAFVCEPFPLSEPFASDECLIATTLFQPKPAYMLLHLDDFVYGPSSTGDSCVQCMRSFTGGGVAGGARQAYACEQYCMNPYTITTEEEQTQCIDCLALKSQAPGTNNQDVAACEMCIQIANNLFVTNRSVTDKLEFDARAECISCIVKDTPFPETRDWACTECTKIECPTTRQRCFSCLEAGEMDPCACVDGAKRDWLFYAESGACFDPTDTADLQLFLDNETVQGGLELTLDGFAGNASPDACAKAASDAGASVFVADASTGLCAWSLSNVQYLVDLGLASAPAGDCAGAGLLPVYAPDKRPRAGCGCPVYLDQPPSAECTAALLVYTPYYFAIFTNNAAAPLAAAQFDCSVEWNEFCGALAAEPNAPFSAACLPENCRGGATTFPTPRELFNLVNGAFPEWADP